MSKIDNFPYPTPIPAKIWGCSLNPFGVDPSYAAAADAHEFAESADSEMVRLISREIISQNSNL